MQTHPMMAVMPMVPAMVTAAVMPAMVPFCF
jgi:hypothetical protein